jgi:hypothetical protein
VRCADWVTSPGPGVISIPNVKRDRTKFRKRMEMSVEGVSGGRRKSTDHESMTVDGRSTGRKILEIWERKSLMNGIGDDAGLVRCKDYDRDR